MKHSMKLNSLILIPALNPNEKLLNYIDELLAQNVKRILVINDGSNPESDSIFRKVASRENCIVFQHAVNLGKGRALKNGMNYFLNMDDVEEFNGIITVDSDGQHSVKDVIMLSELMNKNNQKLLLGKRNFTVKKKGIPLKSRLGNNITSLIFRFLFGKKVQDTQTGLRGIPKELIKQFIELQGERFEYEMNMLIQCAVKDIDMDNIPIETIYINDNSETHFRPIKDSIQIYYIILKSFLFYIFSSLVSFVIDIGVFQVTLLCLAFSDNTRNIFTATIIARIISSLFNYSINKTIVFECNNKKGTMLKYYILCAIQMIASAFLVSLFTRLFDSYAVNVKMFIDVFLFFFSYQIQKNLVFKN